MKGATIRTNDSETIFTNESYEDVKRMFFDETEFIEVSYTVWFGEESDPYKLPKRILLKKTSIYSITED